MDMNHKILVTAKKVTKFLTFLSSPVLILSLIIIVGVQNSIFRDDLRREFTESFETTENRILASTNRILDSHTIRINANYLNVSTRQDALTSSMSAFEGRFSNFVLTESSRVSALISQIRSEILEIEGRNTERFASFTDTINARVNTNSDTLNSLRIYDAIVLENLNDLKFSLDRLYDTMILHNINTLNDPQREILRRSTDRSERARELLNVFLRNLETGISRPASSTVQP